MILLLKNYKHKRFLNLSFYMIHSGEMK